MIELEEADPVIKQVYRFLVLSTPVDRLRHGVQITLSNMSEMFARSNELANILMPAEYEAYVHVANLPVSPKLKAVAEALLCVPERHIVASFFRRAFTTLKGYKLFKMSLEQLRRIE